MTRKCLGVAVSAVAVCAVGFADGVKLRGYGGAVAAAFEKGAVEFTCENAAVAETVYAKLLRDLAGISALRPTVETVETARGAARVFTFASGRAATVAIADERLVKVLDAPDAGTLKRALAKDGGLRFPEPKTYPPYLDYYDLRALKFYKRPMDSFLGYGVENHWTFAEKVGIGGLVSHGIDVAGTKGPGVYSYLPWDFGVDEAARAGSMLTLCPTFAGQMPPWMRDANPEKCAKVQTHTLVTEWIQGVEGMPFDNDGPGFPEATSPMLAFQKQTIERYVGNPGLGGWQFYCGKPIGDQLGKGMFGILWDASEEGLEAQRHWLMSRYTLAELSERWTGDRKAYRRWRDVPPMQLIDLKGGDWDPDRLDIFGLDWQWAKAPEARTWQGAKGWVEDKTVETGVPPSADAVWVDAPMPPSQRCNYLESGRCWYKATLPASDWLAANRSKTLYVRLVGFLMDGGRFHLWANGRHSVSDAGGVCTLMGAAIEPGALRNDGTDELVIEMPGGRCCGRITGPVSLSPNPAQNFPYADPRANARHLDNINFQDGKIIERNLKVFLAGRALDPDRPIAISGADMPILSEMAPTFAENGFAMQSTATDGFYFPFLPDMGRQYGFYFIGEPSRDVAADDRFDRNFGTIFYTGASSTAVFMDIEQYMDFEAKTGGMTARMPITRLVGKYLVDEPRVALFASTLSSLCGTEGVYQWNLARGEMQSVHYDATMTHEKALRRGLVTPEQYPLLLDCGADVMNDGIVDDLRRYVEAGGTFVAFTETGRHTETERDAHPLAALSGFRTTDLKPGVKTLSFAAGNATFPLWAGRTFNANGYGKHTAANWRWNRALEKTASDADVLATWADGTIAAGVRKVGKGRVVTLASGFWREASDIQGKWVPSRYNDLTDQLFAQLGAERNADASSYNVWTRKATSKDGLEDWLIAFNVAYDTASNAPYAVTSALAFKTAEKPVRVYDAFTGADVAGWIYSDGFVRLPEIELGPWKTRIFAAAKPIPVTDALQTWWDEKVTYWKKGPDHAFPQVKAPGSDILTFDEWEFTTDPSKGDWRPAKNQTWKLQFPDLKDYRGPAVYRARFTIPAEKKGATFVVRYTTKTIYDQATLLMNGTPFRDFDQARVHRELNGEQATDVSALLNYGGENTLEIRVEGGKLFTAGICDVVWMHEEKPFAETISLDGDWTCVMKDFVTEQPGKIPGRNACRFLRRKFTIPASWDGKDVYFRIVHPENTVSSVVIDGVGYNLGGLKPFGNRELINVTELVKPGQEQTLELWHRWTVPVDWKGKAWGWPPEATMTIDSVALGCVE
ncbi:MAG: hypothetical protein ACOX5G_13090 [Kiritimatiellia bacterium]|jgi:hypothetical protein